MRYRRVQSMKDHFPLLKPQIAQLALMIRDYDECTKTAILIVTFKHCNEFEPLKLLMSLMEEDSHCWRQMYSLLLERLHGFKTNREQRTTVWQLVLSSWSSFPEDSTQKRHWTSEVWGVFTVVRRAAWKWNAIGEGGSIWSPPEISSKGELDSWGKRDGKQISSLCSVAVSRWTILKRDRMPTSVTNKEVVVGSGASVHVASNPTLLSDIKEIPDFQA